MDALIGHTGFVGGAMLRQGRSFDFQFNSRNIADISGRSFSTIVCAGVSAVKWIANQNPQADWEAIQALIDGLSTVRAERFILISTVDVYPVPVAVTEADIPAESTQAYGRHRLRLENWIRDRFATHHIVRLPGLFGLGLKKNIIFDLMNKNNLHLIHPRSRFQWYPVDALAEDLDRVVQTGLHTLNVAPEPVETARIINTFFQELAPQIAPSGTPAVYDMRTQYPDVLRGHGTYHLTADAVLEAMEPFVTQPPRQAAP